MAQTAFSIPIKNQQEFASNVEHIQKMKNFQTMVQVGDREAIAMLGSGFGKPRPSEVRECLNNHKQTMRKAKMADRLRSKLADRLADKVIVVIETMN